MLFALRRWYAIALLTLVCFVFAAVLWPVEADVLAPGGAMAPSGWTLADLDEAELRTPVPNVYVPDRVSFALQFKDEVSPYRIASMFVMPGETVEVEAIFTQDEGEAAIEATAGRVEVGELGGWRYTAPEEPGHYVLRVGDERAQEAILVNVFVKVPYDGSETLNGYRIGQYETEPYRDNPTFTRPEGFVEVTEAMLDIRLTPHFMLGQFLCKQESAWPKYTLVNERLLLKLEMLLEETNQRGIEAPTFFVMSSFRTPFYNASIGNRTRYSVHLYGGAADIFIDRDRDARMDDLDGDGRVTADEARTMASIVEELTDETWYRPFVGGLGLYPPASHRGPFIHVDVRGERVRW